MGKGGFIFLENIDKLLEDHSMIILTLIPISEHILFFLPAFIIQEFPFLPPVYSSPTAATLYCAKASVAFML